MAEAIAIGASVIAILQITDRIIGICKSFIRSAQDAPSDLRAILLEVSALKSVLENLEFLIGSNDSSSVLVCNLCEADGPVDGCLRSLQELEGLFPRDSVPVQGQEQSKRRKLKSTLTSLAWPLKETKARKLLDDIVRYKSTITLTLTTESLY